MKNSCKVPKRAHLAKLQHLDVDDALLQLLQLLLLGSLVPQQLQVLLAQLALGLLQGSPLSAQLLQQWKTCPQTPSTKHFIMQTSCTCNG